jgi:hypothetical protein
MKEKEKRELALLNLLNHVLSLAITVTILEVPETGFKNTFSWKKLKIKHCEQMTES